MHHTKELIARDVLYMSVARKQQAGALTADQLKVLQQITEMGLPDCKATTGGPCPVDIIKDFAKDTGVDYFLAAQSDGRACNAWEIVQNCAVAIHYCKGLNHGLSY